MTIKHVSTDTTAFRVPVWVWWLVDVDVDVDGHLHLLFVITIAIYCSVCLVFDIILGLHFVPFLADLLSHVHNSVH
jgi:hypothetical protein